MSLPRAFQVLLALSGLAASALASSTAGASSGCEPAADVGMQARVVSALESGETATILVEVSLDPLVTITEASLEAALRAPGGPQQVPGLESRSLTVIEGVSRKLLYRVDLPRYSDHDLFFTLRPSDPAWAGPLPSAHVRVGLDPSHTAVRRGDSLEYRAVPGVPPAER